MSEPVPPSTPRPARAWWRGLAYAISMAALSWVVLLWWDQWPRVMARISAGDRIGMVVGLLLAIASGYANFVAFAVLVRRLMGASMPLGALSHLYFVAQLLKHLPGRVWGIGYQATLGRREGTAAHWVVTNLVHMAAASYVALGMAAVVVIWPVAPALALLLSLVAVAVYFAALPVSRRMAAWLSKGSGWRARGGSYLALVKLDQRSWSWVFLAFLLSGLLHYGSWVMYAGVIGLDDVDAALTLCAIYMLAWFAGYLAFLTPSGIGVRELVFLALASGFDADVVAVMAVFGRASFLAVDVLVSLPFLLRGPKA